MAGLSSVGLDAAFATVDQLQRELKTIEAEENRVKRELEDLNSKKQRILEELKKFNDDQYEENMLHLVYEQRRSENKK